MSADEIAAIELFLEGLNIGGVLGLLLIGSCVIAAIPCLILMGDVDSANEQLDAAEHEVEVLTQSLEHCRNHVARLKAERG